MSLPFQVRLSFEPETPAASMEEWNRLQCEIANLQSFSPFPGVVVEFEMLPTLFDGKCINCILGNKASNSCGLCGATPKQISKQNARFLLKDEAKQFGFSPCHFLMRSFEWCLHVGYHQKFKRPRLSTKKPWLKKIKSSAST